MREWFFKGPRKRKPFNWLALDSWIDSGLYGLFESGKDAFGVYSSIFARFQVKGWKKFLNEGMSEGMTTGTGGLLVMLAFAIPAFQETNAAWQTAGKFSVTFLDRYGNEIGKRGILHSDAVPLEEIPDFMIKATLATEDRRFYEHYGIDVMGTVRAMVENVRAKDVVQGGSSITQQLAKNLFLSPEKSLERKIKEAFLAIWLESRLTKREILKLYMDRAYMGGGAFGVEAASQFYYGKSVREVTLSEAALLAGLFKAPTRYAPHINLPAARARANEVLTNMVQAGYLSEGQVYGARLNPAQIEDRSDYYSPDWFLDWAFEEVQRIMADRDEYVLTARTTVDVSLQKAAEASVETTLRQSGKAMRAEQAALVSMETDGAVRALVGGRDYGESQFNRATHAMRQPGSSFKPYVYLTALENGFKPNSRVVDGPVSCGRWSPKNYAGGYRGAMTVSDALARSINTIAVKLSLAVDRQKLLDNVHKIGLVTVAKTCSMALGDTGISPLEHTMGYAVFASGGKAIKPYAIEEMHNSRGELVYDRARDEQPPKQIFERKYVEQLNQMLGLVITSGTGRRAQLEFTTAVGKTGTSSAYRDAWFMGFTGQYVTGVWFGNDDYTPMGRVTGGSLPAQTWKEYMVFAHSTPNIPQIPGVPLHPNQVAELERMAARKEETPEATVPAAGLAAIAREMPSETRRVLEAMGGLFKGAAAGTAALAGQPAPAALQSGAEPTDQQSRLRFIRRQGSGTQ